MSDQVEDTSTHVWRIGHRIDADWATRARHLLDDDARLVREGLHQIG